MSEVENPLEALAEACEARAETYALLSRLFATEVDQEFLEALCAMMYPVESGNAQVDEGHYAIAKYLSNEWIDPVTKLAVDYAKTFLGDGMDTYAAAYPYESVYTSPKRLTMQAARDEVLAIYRSQGLDKANGWNVAEDHVAAELEFMRARCLRCAEALRAEDEETAVSLFATQQNFLEGHILEWVPLFTSDARRFSKTLFYQGVTLLTDGFLSADQEFLASVLSSDEAEAAE